jgi:hypothetical protein
MATITRYNVGTATVAKGGAVVTFGGAAVLDTIRVNDLFMGMAPIVAVDPVARTATLEAPGWIFDALNASPYHISYLPPAAQLEGAVRTMVNVIATGSVFDSPDTTIASAANGTTDIGAQPTYVLTVTGTNAITSFGTKPAKFRVVTFLGALTLTHNAASLILKGAANRQTAAGDTGFYVSDGSGNWREVGYFAASGYVTPSGVQVLSNKTFSGNTYFPSGVWAADGKVGIGTTAVDANSLLHVSGQVFVSQGYSLSLGYGSGSYAGGIIFRANPVSGGRAWLIRTDDTANGDFVLKRSTAYDTSPSVTVLCADRGGNIGIGTATPKARAQIFGATNTNLLVVGSGTSSNLIDGSPILIESAQNAPASVSLLQNSVFLGSLGSKAGDSNFYITNGTDGSALGTPGRSVTLTTAGNVGIGTTSPLRQLTLANGTGDAAMRIDSPVANNAYLEFSKANVIKWQIYLPSNSNDLRFWDATSDRLTLQNGGNVGIGTTAPTKLLTVYSNQSYTTNESQAVFAVGNTNNNGIYGYITVNQTAKTVTVAGVRAGQANDVSILLNPAGGNVGIGTTSPGAQLDIFDGSNHCQIQGSTVQLTRTTGPAYIWSIASGGTLCLGTGGTMGVAEASLVLSTGRACFFNGNVGVGSSSFGNNGVYVIAIGSGTPPTSNIAGGQLYVENGVLKYRGSNGTVTQLAAA